MKNILLIFLLAVAWFLFLGSSTDRGHTHPAAHQEPAPGGAHQPAGHPDRHGYEEYQDDGYSDYEYDEHDEMHPDDRYHTRSESGTPENPQEVSVLPDGGNSETAESRTARSAKWDDGVVIPPPAPSGREDDSGRGERQRPTRSSKGYFRECRIFNGQISSCGGPYQGEAVAYHNGAFRKCRIFNGRISGCGSPYQGEAVVYNDGVFRKCRIFNGRISGCGSPYQGTAVILRR